MPVPKTGSKGLALQLFYFFLLGIPVKGKPSVLPSACWRSRYYGENLQAFLPLSLKNQFSPFTCKIIDKGNSPVKSYPTPVVGIKPGIGNNTRKCQEEIVSHCLPQHFLYFLPLPQGHRSLRPTLEERTGSFRAPSPAYLFSTTCRGASLGSWTMFARKI